METILKVLVGSRLHGLNNDASDYDWRGIFVVPLMDIVSPFRKQAANHWIEGKEDQTSYELSHYVKLAAQCNPTILETLWSPIIKEKDPVADEMIEKRFEFLDSDRIYFSHLGYSQNQIKKMDLYNPDSVRTPKTIIAYIRTLRQATELLRDGDFNPVYEYSDKDFLMEIKYNFNVALIPHISEKMHEVREDLENVYKNSKLDLKPNIEWIEDYLMRTYFKGELK